MQPDALELPQHPRAGTRRGGLRRPAGGGAGDGAAIGHGPQLLISANGLEGWTLTCWLSIAIDVKNAGGLHYDRSVLEDGNLITSRKGDDVPALAAALVRAIGAGA